MKFCSLSCVSTGKFNGRWNGGKKIDNFGYVLLWVPKEKRHRKEIYQREHRIIMETHLGRKLRYNEIVHHKNENRKDNRLENLEVQMRGDHARYHIKKKQHEKSFSK